MKKWMAVPVAGVLALGVAGSAAAVTGWNQGFESSTDGWYGGIERVASGTDGITSAEGSWHATPALYDYSTFAGYSDTWDGAYIAELDVYLDPAWTAGDGFDYSVAANGSDGKHQRDFIFHVTKDSSTGQLLIAGSNNTNFVPREDLESINHHAVTEAGWYTLQHSFYDNAGTLAVDMNVLDVNGDILWTETRNDPSDTMDQVGSNRYAWFTALTIEDLAIDNHELYMTPVPPSTPTSKDECTDGGWESFDFKNQGQCIASIEANEKAGK